MLLNILICLPLQYFLFTDSSITYIYKTNRLYDNTQHYGMYVHNKVYKEIYFSSCITNFFIILLSQNHLNHILLFVEDESLLFH